MQQADPIQEGARIMTICNACRYCEGYCAVFPAMERRLSFAEADLYYLANLCHNCAECFYACQYAPPHEFAVNVPKTLAEIRLRSYREYAWPRPLAAAFSGNARWVGWTLSGCLIVAVFAMAALPRVDTANGDFYSVIPHDVMAALFGGVSLLVLLRSRWGWSAVGGNYETTRLEWRRLALLQALQRMSCGLSIWTTAAQVVRTRPSGTPNPGAGSTILRFMDFYCALPRRR